MYIGDEVRDIVSCKHVGIPIYSVTWGFDEPEFLKEQNEKGIVESVEQLQKLLLA